MIKFNFDVFFLIQPQRACIRRATRQNNNKGTETGCELCPVPSRRQRMANRAVFLWIESISPQTTTTTRRAHRINRILLNQTPSCADWSRKKFTESVQSNSPPTVFLLYNCKFSSFLLTPSLFGTIKTRIRAFLPLYRATLPHQYHATILQQASPAITSRPELDRNDTARAEKKTYKSTWML